MLVTLEIFKPFCNNIVSYILIVFLIFTINFPLISYASETFGDAMNWYNNKNDNKTPRQNYILGLKAQEKGLNIEALSFYKKAANAGMNSAKSRLVAILLSSGDPKNKKDARKILMDLSKKDDLNAIKKLAWMYENGIGGPSSLKKAQSLYKRAVQLGSNDYLLLLSNLSLKGVHGGPNVIEAISYSIVASRKNVRGASKLYNAILPFIKSNDWDEIEVSIASIESEIRKINQ